MEDTARKKSYINWILMAVNALVFLYLEVAGSSEDAYFMYTKGAMLKAAVMGRRGILPSSDGHVHALWNRPPGE